MAPVSWIPSGYGGGGRFTAIAVDEGNPNTVFIGSDVAGVFRSRDGGKYFEIKGNGLGGFCVSDIAIDPENSRRVYTLTDAGIFFSSDGGDHWELFHEAIRYRSRFSGSHLLLITSEWIWAATNDRGLFRIPRFPIHSIPEPLPGLEHTRINGIIFHNGFLTAGTTHGVFQLHGNIWKPLSEGFVEGPPEVMDIGVSGKNLLAVVRRSGVFCWDTESATWKRLSSPGISRSGLPIISKALAAHPDVPDRIFVGTHPENWPFQLFQSADLGRNWTAVHSFHPAASAASNWTDTLNGIEQIRMVSRNTEMWLTDWWNVWKSTNRGESWLQKHQGLQNTVVNDLKIHPVNSNVLFLCTADNGLMISIDRGKTWRRSMKGAVDGHAKEIEIFHHDPSRMVLLVIPWKKNGRFHVYESRNSGADWHDIGFSVPLEPLPGFNFIDGDPTNIELDPFHHDTMYVATNGYGVFQTTDGGKQWRQVNQGLTTPFIKGPGALRISATTPGILYASTQQGGVFQSVDGARNWKRITTGNRFCFGMDIHPQDPSRIVVGCDGNVLLISTDSGKSWIETRLPIPFSHETAVNSVMFHPGLPDCLWAGTIRYDVLAGNGLFMSRNRGKSFQSVQMDLPAVNIHSITQASVQPLAVYIGFNGTGLFRLEVGGNS
jgi:photosystem II stability/assembly factor-like uncharacterized protein